MTLTLDQLKSLHAFVRYRIAQAVFCLAIGAASVTAWNLVQGPLSLQALVISVAVVLLLAGGIASSTMNRSALMALFVVVFPLYGLMAESMMQAPAPGAESSPFEDPLAAFLPFIEMAPIILAVLSGLIGVTRLTVAILEARKIAESIKELEGSSIQV
jgi:hypothetical protein